MTRPASGLDLSLGDLCSATAFGWALRTFRNRAGRDGEPLLRQEGTFASLVLVGDATLALTSDGIGTKVEVAERTGTYHTLGWDLVAMVVDDLVALGVEPTNLTNILDVDTLDLGVVDALMRGLHDAAIAARVAVVGGEIAELGTRIGGWGPGMHFNWCATALGILPSGQPPLDGRAVRPGDALVALESPGLRSNGFSLARRVLSARHGEDWHLAPFEDGASWGEALLVPSRIYAPLVVDALTEGVPLHGVAHITGGGLPDKLGRVLKPNRLGALLDDLPPVPPVFARLVELGPVPSRQAWHLWNMGTGMVLVVPPDHASALCERAAAAGCPARVAGRIRESSGIEIQRDSEVLTYGD
ncbi:MAG: phosphoribosylformylglycinamidine cyclo-ligase [Deltaproteobacteria bacterium]|nr:phosphoribosylformylglycinamidine cyclo-ligase [Deltaproteobacteria bacterium]